MSHYGTPIFITPKKKGNMRFITDYQKLNQKITRKSYPLPRIGEIMQKLKGLQYAMVLDLNVEYYTIDILPESCNIETIVTEFGEFRFNVFPMGMCASGDIF